MLRKGSKSILATLNIGVKILTRQAYEGTLALFLLDSPKFYFIYKRKAYEILYLLFKNCEYTTKVVLIFTWIKSFVSKNFQCYVFWRTPWFPLRLTVVYNEITIPWTSLSISALGFAV